jgi:hypothetical protein
VQAIDIGVVVEALGQFRIHLMFLVNLQYAGFVRLTRLVELGSNGMYIHFALSFYRRRFVGIDDGTGYMKVS